MATDVAQDTDTDLFKTLLAGLTNKTRRGYLNKCDAYYELETPLNVLAPALAAEFGSRLSQLVINFPRLVTSSFEERIDIEGFRRPGTDKDDVQMTEWWQATNGTEKAQQLHTEMLALSRGATIVGTNPDGVDQPPVISVESPFDVHIRNDPRARTPKDAIKVWVDDDGSQHAMLYVLGRTIPFTREGRTWTAGKVDNHGLSMLPVVPFVNHERIKRPYGRSQFHDIFSLSDAANTIATNMMVSAEFHAMPRRWAFGVSPDDFKDPKTGQTLSTWSMVAGRMWTSSKSAKDVSVGQFTEASLDNFHQTIKLLANLVAQMCALPFHYVGFGGENPPSADALRSSEVRLIKGVERMHTPLGGSWERTMTLVDMIARGVQVPDPTLRQLEVRWRNPATPTVAQMADASVKLVQGAVIPKQQARLDLGYSDGERTRMEEWDKVNATDPTIAALAAPLTANVPPSGGRTNGGA